MTLAEIPEPERCPQCGHLLYKHRHHGAPSQSSSEGAAVECWAPVAGFPLGPYDGCGCRWLVESISNQPIKEAT